ncbi:hypothetical protein JQ629_16230 [Bradyrhizobium sp. AUGA SZCCT0222]|uniref:hypothetical protein n=1 Tax=Bradyrhizobium sp. AUGA SZCCT0222 TaxID=2807668 RepID=UPI001BAC6CA0|nr:hypothetical protein [Bradyrhizobium sp. AUGA SZCCT0222]MBR1269061.1 hypothetical protein [Bradyrhizobium sp. AUGA SZCCT0222]
MQGRRRALSTWRVCAASLALSPPLAHAQPVDWSKMPTMQIERQFGGPLKDTVIQRLRDPVDGTICMVYLPINAPHSPQQTSGYVQYGSTTIGSISCFAGPAPAPPLAAARPKPAPAQRASAPPPEPPAPLDQRWPPAAAPAR